MFKGDFPFVPQQQVISEFDPEIVSVAGLLLFERVINVLEVANAACSFAGD